MTATVCDHCQNQIDVPMHYIGGIVKCTHCGGEFVALRGTKPSSANREKLELGVIFLSLFIVVIVIPISLISYGCRKLEKSNREELAKEKALEARPYQSNEEWLEEIRQKQADRRVQKRMWEQEEAIKDAIREGAAMEKYRTR